ncbi:PilZ domain-containing protein [Chitinimonas sp.]|uniref:PilZ domain-containing protein n=1 Tax=Chitinimonas sp. TaxID=1934313 RepID=UPI002F94E657
MAPTLTIKLDAPLAWQASAGTTNTDGVLLLRVLALQEAAPPHLDEEDGPDALRWQAMEARLDLTLQLLGQLLARGEPAPPARTLELSGEGARWQSTAPQAVGSEGLLALYLSPSIPQALQLPARVTQCQEIAAGQWQIEVSFQHRDAELQDWLEKTIFRRHRREVYERKHSHDT